jgi:hypothetical protein
VKETRDVGFIFFTWRSAWQWVQVPARRYRDVDQPDYRADDASVVRAGNEQPDLRIQVPGGSSFDRLFSRLFVKYTTSWS